MIARDSTTRGSRSTSHLLPTVAQLPSSRHLSVFKPPDWRQFIIMASALTISSTLPLPNSSNQIPRLGFGVYKSTAETCVRSCLTALKAGYRHIDSAQFYANEAQVGQAVKESGIPREEIYITTKVLTASADVPSTYERILESVKKIDDRPDGYVDLFLIHNASTSEEGNKIMWLALEKAKANGKVKEIGVSNAGKKHIEALKEYATVWPPAVNQIEVGAAHL